MLTSPHRIAKGARKSSALGALSGRGERRAGGRCGAVFRVCKGVESPFKIIDLSKNIDLTYLILIPILGLAHDIRKLSFPSSTRQ
jgi:hypothetical protein